MTRPSSATMITWAIIPCMVTRAYLLNVGLTGAVRSSRSSADWVAASAISPPENQTMDRMEAPWIGAPLLARTLPERASDGKAQRGLRGSGAGFNCDYIASSPYPGPGKGRARPSRTRTSRTLLPNLAGPSRRPWYRCGAYALSRYPWRCRARWRCPACPCP